MERPHGKRAPRRPFRKGLLGQLLVRTILPASGVLALLAGLSGWEHHSNRLAVSRSVLFESAQAVANWLDVKNREGMSAATLMAGIQRGGLFGQRKTTIGSLRTAIEDMPQISGICIAYEPMPEARRAPATPAPGATPAAGGGEAEPSGGDAPMVRFVAGWYRDPGSDGIPVQRMDTGMERGASYVALKAGWDRNQSAEPMVSEPIDSTGGPIVQYACPIVTNDRFYGALQVERRLSDLRAELEGIARAGRVDVAVVSPGGRVVAACAGSQRPFASDPSGWTGRSVVDLDAAATVSRVLELGARTTPGAIEDSAARGRSFYAVATVPAGAWTVVVSVDERVVLGPIRRDLLRTSGIALAGVALISVTAFIPTRRLVRRLNAAVRRAQEVASGDLSRAPGGADLRDDETGDLLRALDGMTADLNALVSQVRGANEAIAATATELVTGSGLRERQVAAFGNSSAEVASALQQITATGQELSREVNRVDEMASGTVDRAQAGRSQLEQMEARMRALGDATEGVTDRLGTINERASNIGGVVTLISKVAEQTNLLSVNAAIEAEKAGQYGLGFLVVAREIRRLADQTSAAASDIERIVRDMESAVASGTMDLDRFGQQVRRSVAEARELRQGVSDVIGSIEESTRSFGAVRTGMTRQAAGAVQISEAMGRLRLNAEASAQAARESTEAAESLHRAVGKLDAAVAAFRLRS